jgi:hypothetical protein
MVITPAVIGSCAAVMLLVNATGVSRWFSHRGARRRQPLRRGGRSDPRSLLGLRHAIVGNGKREIASVFGPPHSAAIIGAGDTWYYPLRPSERLAMAISFEKGTAREVEFFHAPG